MADRIQLTNDLIRKTYLRVLKAEAEPGRLHILGLRGVVPDGPFGQPATGIRISQNIPNKYNDGIILFGTHLECFLGTVDPGLAWTLHPSNPQGCAHLCNGTWHYKKGLHKGKPALVQAGPVTVWRDRDKDGVRDPGEILDHGFFGVNIHQGGAFPSIGTWSAGCQNVIAPQWARFWSLIEESDQDEFTYFLTDGYRPE